MGHANMLKHPDRDDAVKGLWHMTVVLQAQIDFIFKA